METLGFFQVLGAPLAACLLFSGILAYLGVHIVRRQVIFVDLALGQVAALGVLVGFHFGLEPESPGAQLFAAGFTLVAAALFAVTRRKDERIPQEAIVGVVFAVASALTYIVVDRSPHGAEHVADILTGSLLWTSWPQVGRAALVVAVAAAALLGLHGRLVALGAEGAGGTAAARLLDFVFFACFGLVISTTVRIAGVLPTFAMLVAPAILGCLAFDGFRGQLALAWAGSSLVGAAGLAISFALDLTAGPALVAAHGIALLAGALTLHVLRAASRGRALARVAAGALASVLLVSGIVAGGRWLAGRSWANPTPLQQSAPEGAASARARCVGDERC